MEVPNNYSWMWRKILKFRVIVLPLIKLNLSTNGCSNFWDGPWAIQGHILSKRFNFQQMQQAGISSTAMAKDFIHDGVLSLPYLSNQAIRSNGIFSKLNITLMSYRTILCGLSKAKSILSTWFMKSYLGSKPCQDWDSVGEFGPISPCLEKTCFCGRLWMMLY